MGIVVNRMETSGANMMIPVRLTGSAECEQCNRRSPGAGFRDISKKWHCAQMRGQRIDAVRCQVVGVKVAMRH